MRRVDRWKFPLLLLVVAAHAWVGWKLAGFRPQHKRDDTVARPRAQPSDEVLMLLTFDDRESTPPRPRARPARAAREPRPRRGRIVESGTTLAAAPGTDSGASEGAPAVLDLAAPAAPRPRFAAPDALRRPAALAFERTRFDQAWISEGNLTQVAARKSKLAAVVLGALGALRRPCTEKQRSEYDAACVPDAYRHAPSAE